MSTRAQEKLSPPKKNNGGSTGWTTYFTDPPFKMANLKWPREFYYADHLYSTDDAAR